MRGISFVDCPDSDYVIISNALGSRWSYGIGRLVDDVVKDVVFDITSDEGKARKMVELFNRLELSPVHLLDVIEDMLP